MTQFIKYVEKNYISITKTFNVLTHFYNKKFVLKSGSKSIYIYIYLYIK